MRITAACPVTVLELSSRRDLGDGYSELPDCLPANQMLQRKVLDGKGRRPAQIDARAISAADLSDCLCDYAPAPASLSTSQLIVRSSKAGRWNDMAIDLAGG